MSGRRKAVLYHVVGGGRNAKGPVWFVMRRDDLHDWCVAEAPTREVARQMARVMQHTAQVAQEKGEAGS